MFIKLFVMRAINRALMFVLVTAIIATGAFAIHLTHVQASVTVTFGEPEIKTAAAQHVASTEDAAGIYMSEAAPATTLMEMPIETQKTTHRAAHDNSLAEAKKIMRAKAK